MTEYHHHYHQHHYFDTNKRNGNAKIKHWKLMLKEREKSNDDQSRSKQHECLSRLWIHGYNSTCIRSWLNTHIPIRFVILSCENGGKVSHRLQPSIVTQLPQLPPTPKPTLLPTTMTSAQTTVRKLSRMMKMLMRHQWFHNRYSHKRNGINWRHQKRYLTC